MSKKIVMFGDSLTFGYGVLKKDSIEYLLKNKGYDIINSGVNGDNTRNALARIEKDVLFYDCDIVTILFGSNDSAPSEYYYVTPFEYKENIKKIIAAIRAKNKETKIVLITPPPVDDSVFMPYTTNKRLSKYIEIIREVSEEENTLLCDFNLYLSFYSKGDISPYLQEDGCHLSEKGYISFASCILETIEK